MYLRDLGYRHDHGQRRLYRSGEEKRSAKPAGSRVDALQRFLDSDDGANLLTAYRRAANILRIEEKKGRPPYKGEADPSLFAQEEERKLGDLHRQCQRNVRYPL